jgi:hypothetical protein
MSQQHLDVMNQLLQRAVAVKEICASLGSRRVMTYDLTGGPDGQPVHWTVTLDDTVQFSLDRASDPDVVLSGDWSRMIRASRSAQAGDPQDPGLTVHGDTAILTEVGTVLEVARGAAAVPVTFPEV